MAKTVVGLFDSNGEAHRVVQDLIDNGFKRESISLIANSRGLGPDPNAEPSEYTPDAGSNAVAGAETGAVVGGIAGLLMGLGALAIPGIGPVLAAGPLAATLAGASIGAVAGGLIGALVHQGVPEQHAHYYAEGVRRGGTLITVNSPDDQADLAVEILHKHGAADIDQRGNNYAETGRGAWDPSTEPMTDEEIASERTQRRFGTAEGLAVESQRRAKIYENRMDASATGIEFEDFDDPLADDASLRGHTESQRQ